MEPFTLRRHASLHAYRFARRTRKDLLFIKTVLIFAVINILFIAILTNSSDLVSPDNIPLTDSTRATVNDRLGQINYSSKGNFGIDVDETHVIHLPKEKMELDTTNNSANSSNWTNYRKVISTFYSESKQHDFSVSVSKNPYLIRNPTVCENRTDLEFIVVVTSATSRFGRRKFIRQTWGNSVYFEKYKFKVIFLVGIATVTVFRIPLQRESDAFKDMVQGNFLDTYKNLTHKTILGMRWVTENCPNSKFIVKVDDDVLVNPVEILKRIEREYRNKSMEIFCHLHQPNMTVIERDPKNKYGVSGDYFPNMSFYPCLYCSGFFSIMTADVAPVLYETAKRTPVFTMEDVYLTGILLAIRGGGIKLSHVEGLESIERDALECLKTQGKNCVMVGVLSSRFGKNRQKWWDLMRMYIVDEDVETNNNRLSQQ